MRTGIVTVLAVEIINFRVGKTTYDEIHRNDLKGTG